jgi:hypothetical protein
MADDPPTTADGQPQQPDPARRPGLADRAPGSRLRGWELVIVFVVAVIVVVAVVTR